MTKGAIIWRIQGDINNILPLSVFIIDSSFLFFFFLTNGQLSPSTSPIHLPPPHRGTNWIVNSSAEDGGAASAAALLNLQRETVRLQTEHLYLDALLSPCTPSVPPFVPSLHIPPPPDSSSCSDAVWQQPPLGETLLIPADSENSCTRRNQQSCGAGGPSSPEPVTGVTLSTYRATYKWT